jgi:cholesterol oxidase
MNVDWNIVRQEIAGQKVPSAIAKRGGEAPIAGEVFYSINSGAKQSLYRNHLSMAEATGYSVVVRFVVRYRTYQIVLTCG